MFKEQQKIFFWHTEPDNSKWLHPYITWGLLQPARIWPAQEQQHLPLCTRGSAGEGLLGRRFCAAANIRCKAACRFVDWKKLWHRKQAGPDFPSAKSIKCALVFLGEREGGSDLPNLGFGSLNLGECQKHGTTKRPPFSVEKKRHPIPPPPRTQTLKTTFLTIVDCFPDIFCSQCERFGWKGSTLLGLWYPPAYFCGV